MSNARSSFAPGRICFGLAAFVSLALAGLFTWGRLYLAPRLATSATADSQGPDKGYLATESIDELRVRVLSEREQTLRLQRVVRSGTRLSQLGFFIIAESPERTSDP